MFTEEQIQYIVKSIVSPCIIEYDKISSDLRREIDEKFLDVISKSIKLLADIASKLNYENQKNMSFIKAIFYQNHLSSEEHYNKCCEEFDKLNRQLLDEKETGI